MEDSGEWRTFREGDLNPVGQNLTSPNLKPHIPNLQTSHTKPSNLIADDTTDIMVCQTLKPYKKIPRNQGEIVDNRNVILTNLYVIYRKPGEKVCYSIGVGLVYLFESPWKIGRSPPGLRPRLRRL